VAGTCGPRRVEWIEQVLQRDREVARSSGDVLDLTLAQLVPPSDVGAEAAL
jgi:hypothetical protein